MMKSFFKKLAFVMALAMVVSTMAPAATAKAAAEPGAIAETTIARAITNASFLKKLFIIISSLNNIWFF